MAKFSILDLAPIAAGETVAEALHHSLDLARHAELWGYHRFWLAEHHNMSGIASAATAVVIGHVAAGTSNIRVGSGGIMLPNHAPYVIAEQFGTLESLYPGRIDLGLGRAAGADQATARALRRNFGSGGDTFTSDILELRSYFQPEVKGQPLRAIPGVGLKVPLYLLGSSDFSARLAAELGLPFAFASHFAPDYLKTALELYRGNFRPSATLASPYVIVGVNVFAADTPKEAKRLFTSLQLAFLNLLRGKPGELPPPVSDFSTRFSMIEDLHLQRMTRYSAVGSAPHIRRKIEEILDETNADEIMATAQIFDHGARLHSFEMFSGVMKSLTAGERVPVHSD